MPSEVSSTLQPLHHLVPSAHRRRHPSSEVLSTPLYHLVGSSGALCSAATPSAFCGFIVLAAAASPGAFCLTSSAFFCALSFAAASSAAAATMTSSENVCIWGKHCGNASTTKVFNAALFIV
ncbi:hypothetical protein ACHAW5_003966 [Stephanodiscus triporus]|uniref:Uncharacterized protein n=1 Tax=Stephanodiscus triporus TaxID=2934178 RepID=A0ABD3N489_9STRA